MQTIRRHFPIAVFALLAWSIILSLGLHAATWNAASDGFWDVAANWTGNDLPDTVGEAVSLPNLTTPYVVTYRTDDGIGALGTLGISNATLNVNAPGLAVGAGSLASATINIGASGALTATAMASSAASTMTIDGGSYIQTAGGFGNSAAANTITLNMDGGAFSMPNSGNFYAILDMTGGTISIGGAVYSSIYTSTISGGTFNCTSSNTAGNRNGTLTVNGSASVNFNRFHVLGNGEKLQVDGGSFTVTGDTFIVGNNAYAGPTNRNGSIVQTGGTVGMAHANGLIIGNATNTTTPIGAGSLYKYEMSDGTLNVEKITLATAAHTGLGTNAFIMSGGTLNLGAGGIAHGGGAGPQAVELSGGTLGAQSNWSSSLPMSLVSGTTTLRAAHTDGTAHNITLSGNLSGNGGLSKTGAGTLLLNGGNSFSGPVAVTAGTLGGSGSVAGNVIVADGAGLAPGASIGTFDIGGNLTLEGDTNLDWELSTPGVGDLVAVVGTLTLPAAPSTFTLNLSLIDPKRTENGEITLFTYGSLVGDFNDITWNIIVLGDFWQGTPTVAFDGTHIYLQGVNYIPEPSSLFLLGLAGLALRRRRG